MVGKLRLCTLAKCIEIFDCHKKKKIKVRLEEKNDLSQTMLKKIEGRIGFKMSVYADKVQTTTLRVLLIDDIGTSRRFIYWPNGVG